MATRLVRIVRLALKLTSLTALGASLSLLSPAPASAQSAADKATARTLATDAIKLFRAGKFSEALDKMQRAEALYDAPVHLLYIARSQVKLDKYVEGAETYRRLIRSPLEPNAPPAFKEAVDSANRELDELEPRIPTVRIEVEPANVDKLELRIDDEAVPTAVLGIDRPANPGAHVLKAWAPGYETTEARIDLKPGEKKPVKLVLRPGSSPPPAVAPGGPGPGPGPGYGPGPMPPGPGPMPPPGQDYGAPPPPPGDAKPPSKVGFMAGLRLGGAIPTGNLGHDAAAEEDVPIKDSFEPGGGGEIHGGVRFFKYFTGVLFYERHVLKPGTAYDDPPAAFGNADVEVRNTSTVQNAGIGAMIGTPRNQLGGYGEIDLLFLHEFATKRDFSGPVIAECSVTETYRGPAFRIGGGMNIPVADFLHLTPFLMATLGSFEEVEIDTDCGGQNGGKLDIPDENQAVHGLVFLGIGGDFLFGNDKPVD